MEDNVIHWLLSILTKYACTVIVIGDASIMSNKSRSKFTLVKKNHNPTVEMLE